MQAPLTNKSSRLHALRLVVRVDKARIVANYSRVEVLMPNSYTAPLRNITLKGDLRKAEQHHHTIETFNVAFNSHSIV